MQIFIESLIYSFIIFIKAIYFTEDYLDIIYINSLLNYLKESIDDK